VLGIQETPIRKRDVKNCEKAAPTAKSLDNKSQFGGSDATGKSFGNAPKGTPGTEFLKNGISFVVLDEKDKGNNRLVLCQECQTKVRREHAERHANTNH
jgi:hypothetical protein